MKIATLGIALGIASGLLAGALLVRRMMIPNMRKWCARVENEQLDTEIRLDILEYNHLHEDDNLSQKKSLDKHL